MSSQADTELVDLEALERSLHGALYGEFKGECLALIAELRQRRADSERLDWLAHAGFNSQGSGLTRRAGRWDVVGDRHRYLGTGFSIREAIDAARSRTR